MDLRRKALLLAGVGSCGMAAVHFFLPQVYGWKQYLDLVPESLGTGILVVNFLFSFLLLWGGCLTILAAVRRKPIGHLGYLILYGLATFWAIYVLYQSRIPPPVPEAVRRILMIVAVTITVFYLWFLLTRREAEDSRHASKRGGAEL